MTITKLNNALNDVDHSKEKRLEMAQLLINEPYLLKALLVIIGKDEKPNSPKAAWVLEYVVRKNQETIYPYLDTFTLHLDKLKLESSVRPAAKICKELMSAYFSKEKNKAQQIIKNIHLECITTACFDWLIGAYKVAPKAYAITSLFELGKKYDWVHPELQLILEQNYNNGSAAYKARARMALQKIKKLKREG